MNFNLTRSVFGVVLVVTLVSSASIAMDAVCTRLPGEPEYEIAALLPDKTITFVHRIGDESGGGQPRLLVAMRDENERTTRLYTARPDGARGLTTQFLSESPGPYQNVYRVDEGDFDGDGLLDLLVDWTSQRDDQIFRGRSDGTFAAPEGVTYGTETFWVVLKVIADIDGDGRSEVVYLANKDIAGLDYFLVYGYSPDGVWPREHEIFAVYFGPLEVADIDDDGADDILAMTFATMIVSWGDRVAPLTSSQSIHVVQPWYRVDVLDGKRGPGPVRLAFSGSTSPVPYTRISTLHGRPAVYTSGPLSILDTGGRRARYAPLVLDIDRDGDGEIVTPIDRGPYISGTAGYVLHEVDDSGTVHFDAASYMPPALVDVFDADADGEVEHLIYDGSTLAFLDPGTPEPIVTPYEPNPTTTHVGDLNGDGRDDVVVSHSNPAVMEVLLATAGGTFATSTLDSPGLRYPSFRLVDFDADGVLDLFASSRDGWVGEPRFIAWAWGRGDGSFSPWATFPWSLTDYAPIAIALGDIDGDADIDVVAVSSTGTLRVFLMEGGAFIPGPSKPLVPHFLALGDIDGDGKDDLFVRSYGENVWYPALGGGAFGSAVPVTGLEGVYISRAWFEDLDGDAVSDLTIADGPGIVRTFKGDGRGFYRHLWSQTLPELRIPELCDIDGDGLLDIATTNRNVTDGSHGFVYLADGAGGFRRSSRSWYPNANAGLVPGRLLGGVGADVLRFDIYGGQRAAIVNPQKVAALAEDTEPPRPQLVVAPSMAPPRYDAAEGEDEWRVAGVAVDSCTAARASGSKLLLPDLGGAPAPRYVADVRTSIAIYREPVGGTPRVTLYGPDEGAVRAIFEGALASAGFPVAQNAFLKLVTDEHLGPPSGEWAGVPRAFAFDFDATGALTGAWAQGPGRELLFEVRGIDATGKEAVAIESFREARARYCATLGDGVICR